MLYGQSDEAPFSNVEMIHIDGENYEGAVEELRKIVRIWF